jgi:5-oxoprolinase (ATP-hydrolysing) subunit A
LMKYVQRVNIGCGLHAGSPALCSKTMALAKEHHLKIGVHPGYDDRANFGRVPVELPDLGASLLMYQVGAMAALAELYGVELTHLKLHGAMYHLASEDEDFAAVVRSVAERFDLPLVVFPNSILHQHCVEEDWPFLLEGFADRRYQTDGTLVPRSEPNALLTEPAEVQAHVAWLKQTYKIDTFCLHGDTPHAVELAKVLVTP